MSTETTIRILAAAILIAAPFSARAALGEETMSMPQMVAKASTAPDHEAIAAEYSRRAAESRAQADRQAQICDSYRGFAIEKLHLDTSCKLVVRSYHDGAKMLEEMAEAHRALARQMTN
jgi:hypothetical protein